MLLGYWARRLAINEVSRNWCVDKVLVLFPKSAQFRHTSSEVLPTVRPCSRSGP
jgi:hypothetical protein